MGHSQSRVSDSEMMMFTAGTYETVNRERSQGQKSVGIRHVVIILSITFLVAFFYVVDTRYDDIFNALYKIAGQNSFLRSASLTKYTEYKNKPSIENGLILLGTPQSELSVLASFLDTSGFRLVSGNEKTSAVFPHPKAFSMKLKENEAHHPLSMEPYIRLDSLQENNLLLQSQGYKWDSDHIYKYNNTLERETIYTDGFVQNSTVLKFVSGTTKDWKPWLWFDPTLCVTLPAWVEVITSEKRSGKTKNESTTYINATLPKSNVTMSEIETPKLAALFSYQHPYEVAQNIHFQYPSLSIVKGMQLWLDYTYKCVSNLDLTGVCSIYVSLADVLEDPTKEVKRILKEFDERCGIAPAFPGLLHRQDAKTRLKRIEQYNNIKNGGKGKKSSTSDLGEQVIMDALGVSSYVEIGCDSEAIWKNLDTDVNNDDWGSPKLAEAIAELDQLKQIALDPESKERLQHEKELILEKLQKEIEKWTGDEFSDAIHELIDMEESASDSLSEVAAKEERKAMMNLIRTEIRKAFSDSMQVYCDLQNGTILSKDYVWPQDEL